MIENAMEQKTAVFSLGDLSRENAAAGRDMDDSTRELPLIAGRFAGRQWIVEDLKREAEEKPARPEKSRAHRLLLAACAAAAMLLLVFSLMGQARLAALNDRAVALSGEVRDLRQEQIALRVEAAAGQDLSEADRYAVETLGMQMPRGDQVLTMETRAQDKATVLGVRRGRGASYLWNVLLDELGAYLH